MRVSIVSCRNLSIKCLAVSPSADLAAPVAPRFLAVDDRDREILTFLPGDVPSDLGIFTEAQLAAAARLLRSLHDTTAALGLRGTSEIICHGDPSPCNAVFHDGLPYAWIDFDRARTLDRVATI